MDQSNGRKKIRTHLGPSISNSLPKNAKYTYVVFSLKYCSLKTKGCFVLVPNSSSPVLERTMENVKGDVVYLN